MKTIIILLLIGLGLWVIVQGAQEAKEKRDVTSPAKYLEVDVAAMERARRDKALGNLSIKNFTWQKGGFGSVMTADFAFENKGDYDVKDITVRCTLVAASGTTIDSNTRTIYELVPARGTKAVKNFNMGFINSQAARSGCNVMNAEIGDYRVPMAKPQPKLPPPPKP